MGQRGKKKPKPLTKETKAQLKEFDKWCQSEIEKDFIEQIRGN